MKRLNIFAKGNLDVHDTLHSLTFGGEVTWNGINQAIKERGGGPVVRVRHETSSGSAATLQASGHVPAAFAGRELPLDSHSLPIQYSRAIFDAPADAYVLSIQPDLQVGLARHRRDGYLFHPYDMAQWSERDREWLRCEFEPVPPLEVGQAMRDLEALVTALRAVSDAPILVFNMSAVAPGESIHCHVGMEDIFSTRIRRFNLGLIELSQRTGISIVDVDRIVAQHGAREMKFDVTHLTAAGCRAVAGEVIRILEDLGCIPPLEHAA